MMTRLSLCFCLPSVYLLWEVFFFFKFVRLSCLSPYNWVVSFHYILEMTFIRYMFWKYFLQFCVLTSFFLKLWLEEQKFISLVKADLENISLVLYIFVTIFRNLCLRSLRLFKKFFLKFNSFRAYIQSMIGNRLLHNI